MKKVFVLFVLLFGVVLFGCIGGSGQQSAPSTAAQFSLGPDAQPCKSRGPGDIGCVNFADIDCISCRASLSSRSVLVELKNARTDTIKMTYPDCSPASLNPGEVTQCLFTGVAPTVVADALIKFTAADGREHSAMGSIYLPK